MFLFGMHNDVENMGNHSRYAKGWNCRYFASIYELGRMCLTNLNTPIAWAYGIRKTENFQRAFFIVIDVDDGISLSDAIARYHRYVHIIGTTKSHNKDKGGKIAERYRVFVATEGPLDAKQYKASCLREAHACGGDLQAAGTAMHFMPLRTIESYAEVGRKIGAPVINQETGKNSFQTQFNYSYSGHNARDSEERVIPPYIQRWLDGDVSPGHRNITCFKAACGLRERGFNEDEILKIVLSSRIPLDSSTQVQSEVESAVRSALRRK